MTKHEQIRAFVQQLLLAKHDLVSLSDADPLLSSGRLSSFDIVSIAAFLEETFAVNFADVGFDQYKFESIDTIVEMLNEMGY